jgi:hypothetical protein
MSGMDMSDVRVHRNSHKPAQLNALAYAQGNDIHLGPGQEQHLPHEAWHVVQQRQGRVRETVQMAGVGVNDEVGLEREADLMGGYACSQGAFHRDNISSGPTATQRMQLQRVATVVVQRNPLRRLVTAANNILPSRPVFKLPSFLTAPAAKTSLPINSTVYRATTESPDSVGQTGFSSRLGAKETVPARSIIFYMFNSYSNPGVVSVTKKLEAAQNFASQRSMENNDDTYYVYEIKADGKQVIDMEKTVPKLFRWIFGGEAEEMLVDKIPPAHTKLVATIPPKEPNSPDHSQ